METQLSITVPEGTIKPELDLVGVDGNAFSVMGAVAQALRRAGNAEAVIDSYTDQATGGDYDHLLRVSMTFIS